MKIKHTLSGAFSTTQSLHMTGALWLRAKV